MLPFHRQWIYSPDIYFNSSFSQLSEKTTPLTRSSTLFFAQYLFSCLVSTASPTTPLQSQLLPGWPALPVIQEQVAYTEDFQFVLRYTSQHVASTVWCAPHLESTRSSTASSNTVSSLLQAEVRNRLGFLQKTHTETQRKCILSHGWPETSSEYLCLYLQSFNQACRNFNEGSGFFLCATRSSLNRGPVDQWEEQTDPDSSLQQTALLCVGRAQIFLSSRLSGSTTAPLPHLV